MHQSDIHPVFVRIGTTIVVPAKAGMTNGMSTTLAKGLPHDEARAQHRQI
jgi:hypothetical protein